MSEWVLTFIIWVQWSVCVCVCVCVYTCEHRRIFSPNILEPEGTLDPFVPASYFMQGGPGAQVDGVIFPSLQIKAQLD